jgi:hypothetical protein
MPVCHAKSSFLCGTPTRPVSCTKRCWGSCRRSFGAGPPISSTRGALSLNPLGLDIAEKHCQQRGVLGRRFNPWRRLPNPAQSTCCGQPATGHRRDQIRGVPKGSNGLLHRRHQLKILKRFQHSPKFPTVIRRREELRTNQLLFSGDTTHGTSQKEFCLASRLSTPVAACRCPIEAADVTCMFSSSHCSMTYRRRLLGRARFSWSHAHTPRRSTGAIERLEK